jgi:acetyl esterase/lipase
MTGDRPIDQVRAMLAGLVTPDMPFLERRAQAEKFAQAFVVPDGLDIETDTFGHVPVEWVIPRGSPAAPVIFHLHGGGYVLGNPAASRPLTTALALKSGARVVSVDYRLAPEHPLPPLLIHAGSDEVLFDDARLLHSAAQAAGVASTLHVYEGMTHVWHMFHPMLPEGGEAIDEIAAFLASRWRR